MDKIDFEEDTPLDEVVELKLNSKALIIYTTSGNRVALSRHVCEQLCKVKDSYLAHVKFEPCKSCK